MHEGSLYLALDGAVEDAIVSLRRKQEAGGLAVGTQGAMLHSARWFVRGLHRDRCEYTFTASGYGSSQFEWRNLEPGKYVAEARRGSDVVWRTSQEVGSDGKLLLDATLSGIKPVDFTGRMRLRLYEAGIMNKTPIFAAMSCTIVASVVGYFLIPGPLEQVTMLMRDGSEAAALVKADALISSGLRDPGLLMQDFTLNERFGNHEQAMVALRAYFELRPNDADAWRKVAATFAGTKNLEAHLEALEKVVGLTHDATLSASSPDSIGCMPGLMMKCGSSEAWIPFPSRCLTPFDLPPHC